MSIFEFPLDEIINNNKKQSYHHHYCFFNGEQEIAFSHNRDSFEVHTYKKYEDDEKYIKHWLVRDITKSSINSLNKRVNKFFEKLNITKPFYDVWDYREYKELYEKLKNNGILDKPNDKTLEITVKDWEYNEAGEKVEIHKPYIITTKNLISNEYILVNGQSLQFHYITFDSLVKLIKFMENLQ